MTDQIGDNWTLRWVMETDGPLTIGAVAPASIAMADEHTVLYHFTIGQDEVAFLRDAQIQLVTAKITLGPD